MNKNNEPDNVSFDLAIVNGHVLSMDKDWTEYPSGLILIKDNIIVYAGPEKGYASYKTNKTIDARGNIVMPTFFNGHTHSAMSLFRGMGSDLPLSSWLQDHIWPAEAKYANGKNVHLGSMISAIEMIRCGTGIFADMYFFQEETLRACEELGIRIIIGEGVLDFPTPNKKTPAEGLRQSEYLWNKYKHHPLANFSVSAHAPYTCSPDVLKEVGELAQRINVPSTTHLAETEWEDGEMKKRYGKSSTRLLADIGFFNGSSVVYHCNYLSIPDIEILKEYNVGIVTNPHSNMKLGSGICPVPELMMQGLNIGIGTDGAASNNFQSLLLDMQFLARLHKMNKHDPTVITSRQLLRMAIMNNAINYGMDKELGSLENGKLADMIIIDTQQAHWQPLHDPYSHLVYSMQPGDVRTTIVNGRVIMEDYEILTVNEDYYIKSIGKLGQEIISK